MLEIDGSMGEGGGQVLRTSLSLSLLTGQPVRVIRIRAKRSNPGVREQHRVAIQAAAAVGRAHVQDVRVGSKRIVFQPQKLVGGDYHFKISTAGSGPLVLQTIFLPLCFSAQGSTVDIVGGTHVPWSPCFHYLQRQWMPVQRMLGLKAQLALDKAGFYPRGGGQIQARIQPVKAPMGIQRLRRGRLLQVQGRSVVSNLPRSIALRQRDQALRRLERLDCKLEVQLERMPALGKGTFLLLFAQFEQGQACYFSLGALGKPAEKVADEAVEALLQFLSGEGVFDQYLADQLLLPLAMASSPSRFTTPVITPHLLTNAAVIEAFGVAQIKVQGALGEHGVVHVNPLGSIRQRV